MVMMVMIEMKKGYGYGACGTSIASRASLALARDNKNKYNIF